MIEFNRKSAKKFQTSTWERIGMGAPESIADQDMQKENATISS